MMIPFVVAQKKDEDQEGMGDDGTWEPCGSQEGVEYEEWEPCGSQEGGEDEEWEPFGLDCNGTSPL